jgi:hypothetical protein
MIRSKLGLSEKVFARNTKFREISPSEAKVFLTMHHIQGSAPSARWCYGLFSGRDLVAVATFCEHQKRYLNLSRLAFRKNLTVVGGAQKLFSNALPLLPQRDIVTFSDNRYSGGHIYPVLGFEKDADLPPSYEWFFRNKLMNKRQCRHQQLPRLLGDLYDPTLTEHQNMYRAGARCLYDAGYQRWCYRRPGTGPVS